MRRRRIRELWHFSQQFREPYKTLWKLDRLRRKPPQAGGVVRLGPWRIAYVDPRALASMWTLQALGKYNDFHTANPRPTILDCGANIGVSVLRYKTLYPACRIIAFEPDPRLYDLLQRNVAMNALQDVETIQAAVWTEPGQRTFLSFRHNDSQSGCIQVDDPGDGDSGANPVEVDTVWLGDYLQSPVDFLKLDIEGAELVVLESCRHLLANVNQMMVEAHYRVQQPGFLIDLMRILEDAGFRIAIYQVFRSPDPSRPYQPNLKANADQYPVLWAWRD
jgi:FkbM family methyltransferase